MRVFVTGAAGFIGSHICEILLQDGTEVVGFDNFSSGNTRIAGVTMIIGDIRNFDDVLFAMRDCTHIVHLAALASVPASVANPSLSEAINLQGTLNVIEAAKQNSVKRIVFSSTAAIYGDSTDSPVTELTTANCQSPYAEDKLAAEVAVLHSGIEAISLRYFNVHGPRQDPNGAYAAVIPKWIDAIINNNQIFINGDGETSRDFCYIDNAVQANILAATSNSQQALCNIFNIAVGERTSLNSLYKFLQELIATRSKTKHSNITYRDFREGDVRHSQADISKANQFLGYIPTHKVKAGLKETINWHFNKH